MCVGRFNVARTVASQPALRTMYGTQQATGTWRMKHEQHPVHDLMANFLRCRRAMAQYGCSRVRGMASLDLRMLPRETQQPRTIFQAVPLECQLLSRLQITIADRSWLLCQSALATPTELFTLENLGLSTPLRPANPMLRIVRSI